MSNWTHAVCAECYSVLNPDRPSPFVMAEPYRELEMCCRCGEVTDAGIYIRSDPADMPHHEDEA